MSIEDKIRQIQQRFRERLGDDLTSLEKIRANTTNQFFNDDALREIEFLAHRVAGLAGAVGFKTLGELARDLDTATQLYLGSRNRPDSQQELHRLVNEYILACRRAISQHL